MGKPAGLIGVIGGAGVLAGAELPRLIALKVALAGARFDQDHPPLALIQATQAPSRSLFLEGRGESFVPAYQTAARQLEALGATVIGMACNTAHAAHAEIQAATGVPVIDLVAAALHAATIAAPRADIGLITSDGTRHAGVYEAAAARAGHRVRLVHVEPSMQAEVTQAIIAVKRGAGDAAPFEAAAQALVGAGVGSVILGCTEIPLVWRVRSVDGTPVIDTLDLLADLLLTATGRADATGSAP
jgi:aspartate racemase